MAKEPAASAATLRKLNAAIQQANAFSGTATAMGAIDTQFNMVEPVIEALGWDRNDPSVVQRAPSDNITMMLSSESGPSIAITTIKQNGQIGRNKSRVTALREASSRGMDWLVVTNGNEWWMVNKSQPDEPFRKIDLQQSGAADTLALLSRTSVESGSLSAAMEVETLDKNVKHAVAETLDSDEFANMLRKQLAKKKTKVKKQDITVSLERMGLSQLVQSGGQAPNRSAKSNTSDTSSLSQSRPAQGATPKKSTTTKPTPAASKTKGARSASTQTPDAPDWIEGATHKMSRKKNVAFMRLEADGSATLLPGSIIASKEGKTIPKPLKNIRAIAQEDQSVVPAGDMLEVAREIKLEGPKSAASFSAGTIVPNITCWTDQEGKPLNMSKPLAKKSAQPAASTATAKSAKSSPDGASDEAEKTPAQAKPAANRGKAAGAKGAKKKPAKRSQAKQRAKATKETSKQEAHPAVQQVEPKQIDHQPANEKGAGANESSQTSDVPRTEESQQSG